MANRDDCNFLSTRCALRCLNEKVSIFAVVMEVGLPRKSRGTDWYRTMKITDESLPQSGMAVNFFEQSVELLPHVLALGDIIVLCDVRVFFDLLASILFFLNDFPEGLVKFVF
uniref:Protection of telomeres 1 protein n=1 Tax=Rhizophora mucronata TaxID=61149 RepID=A0A2P2M0C0_RHIMU